MREYPWQKGGEFEKGQLNSDGTFVLRQKWRKPAELYHASMIDHVGIQGHGQTVFHFQGIKYDRDAYYGAFKKVLGGVSLKALAEWPNDAAEWLREHHPDFNALKFTINFGVAASQMRGVNENLPEYKALLERFTPPRGNGIQHATNNSACIRLSGANLICK